MPFVKITDKNYDALDVIAKEAGVAVGVILNGVVELYFRTTTKSPGVARPHKLTQEQIAWAAERHDKGVSWAKLSAVLGFHLETIRRAVISKKHKNNC